MDICDTTTAKSFVINMCILATPVTEIGVDTSVERVAVDVFFTISSEEVVLVVSTIASTAKAVGVAVYSSAAISAAKGGMEVSISVTATGVAVAVFSSASADKVVSDVSVAASTA